MQFVPTGCATAIYCASSTTARQRLCDHAKVGDHQSVSLLQLGLQALTTDRANPPPARADLAAENRALSSGRLEAFLREPLREGNINVMLPESESKIHVNRREKRETMSEKIRIFNQQYGS